jgi:ankyrin repeat protein
MKKLLTYKIFESNIAEDLVRAVLGRSIDDIDKLIKLGGDINTQDNGDRWSVLMVAACFHTNEAHALLKKLINAGADLNIQNKHGHTALIIASANNRVKNVIELIKAGADMTIKDFSGLDFINRLFDRRVVEVQKWLGSYEAQKLILSKEPSLLTSFKESKIKIHPVIQKEFKYLFSADDLGLLDIK